jgi:hypothetical protein
MILCMLLLFFANVQAAVKEIYIYGNPANEFCLLLKKQGYQLRNFSSPAKAIESARSGSGVLILARDYPQADPLCQISEAMLQQAKKKSLRLYIEYPSAFPGLNLPAKPIQSTMERVVVTSPVFGNELPLMSLLDLHRIYIYPVKYKKTLLELARVVGFDKAEYGLENTESFPLLFESRGTMVAMTALSNFKRGRFSPKERVSQIISYILSYVTADHNFRIFNLPQDVQPMFSRTQVIPVSARLNSIKKGIKWFENGRFFVHPSWKADWLKYDGSNNVTPVGPPVSQSKPNGDGSLGIIEGHTSTIYYDGSHQYRYWMRADVQGEASMALAASGRLLHDTSCLHKSANLINYLFNTSNMRAGAKNDPKSPAFGLIGWATTAAGTFYGDDNARAILGMIGAASYLNSNKWDKELAEAIMANFRTTGKQGFRSERLEERDIIKNGWQFYYNRDLTYTSAHFESWMWACYLWLYHKTGYEPLLSRSKEAIKIMMNGYPEKWLWGSSMQTQRARMILPLAWLVRVEDTPEHRQWLDKMVTEILKYQDESGAIMEEIGKGKGHFKVLSSNSDYGTDEGSLIHRNGEKVSCMLYTCNFAIFSLNEAAQATGSQKYKDATAKLSDFLTRIQVQSSRHKDLDGAWMRAFDYGKWDYWASNADAGWGAWCTLTGWIQSWIVTTQTQILEKQSFWEVTKNSAINTPGKSVIKQMMSDQDK